MFRKMIFLLVFSFSLPAWAGQGDAPLSPPELVPATDRDPERLSMFVTHFFRWWVDNYVRYFEIEPHTKERAEVLKEKEETIKKSVTPLLWYHYKNFDGLEEPDPIFPLGDFEDSWRNTAFSQIVTLQDQTATLIVSFPRNKDYPPPYDKPFPFRVLLQTYQGAWRIGEVKDIMNRDP
jgi:hypothetical protein